MDAMDDVATPGPGAVDHEGDMPFARVGDAGRIGRLSDARVVHACAPDRSALFPVHDSQTTRAALTST